jgi:hypothetical protein
VLLSYDTDEVVYRATSCNARKDDPGDKFEETTSPSPLIQRVEPVPFQTSR